ncbi:MAG: mucoidy inhibitor MuiA family protein [Lachnospiraceae bacterium]|nr:mucoidy inhibitor MuiA family protein [Lachnospiraceae bacterium]
MIITTTKASSVQIYRKGAVVRRSGEAELEAGMNRLRIMGMSASADLASLILYFPQGVSGSNIRTYLPEPDLLEETESGCITERLKLIEREKEVLAEQGERWKDLTAFQNMENVPLTELEEYIGRLPEKLLTLEKRLLELEKEKNKLEKELTEAKAEEKKPVIEADFHAPEKGTYRFEISYHETLASWSPVYEVHSEGKGDTVELRLRGKIVQDTGEDWLGVDMALFSGNPSISGDIPVLKPSFLSIKPEPRPEKMVMGMAAKAAPMMAASAMADTAPMEMAEPILLKRVETAQAQVNDDDTTTEYDLPGKRDLFSGKDGTIADLQVFQIPAGYIRISIPKLDARCYLCAEVRTEDLPNLIRGNADIFLKETFIGSVFISPDTTKKTFLISLGADEKLQISRKQLRKKDSSAMIRNQAFREHEFEINAANKRTEAVRLRIFDQVPVSQDKTILVENVSLDGGEADPSNGEIRWEITLEPQETKTLRLSYKISWPKDKQLLETTPNGFSAPRMMNTSFGRWQCPVCGEYSSAKFCVNCGNPRPGAM